MHLRAGLLALAAALAAASAPAGQKPAVKKSPPPVLDTESFWRCRMIWETDLARTKAGKLVHVKGYKSVRIPGGKKRQQKRVLNVIEKVRRMPPELPPEGWVQPDFDDSSWGRYRGPFLRLRLGMMLLCLRGRFRVDNPAAVGDMKLSLKLIGGARVFLNGQELTRVGLPAGKIKLDTPAKDYPQEAYLTPDGGLLMKPKKHKDRFAKRIREIRDFKVPASKLKKGVNLLAVELHHAPAAEIMYTNSKKKSLRSGVLRRDAWWARLGLESLELVARPGALRPNVGHAGRPKGFQVWNSSMLRRVRASDYGDLNEPLWPIRIRGARNGVFSGRVVASSTEPIKGLKATVTPLTGPGKISASVRYELPDGKVYRGFAHRFDGIEEFPPKEVGLLKWRRDKAGQGAVQPVWVTVRVPAGAKPGLYKGKLTITAQGQKSVSVPIEMKVANWTLPSPRDFRTYVGLVQSPPSVAMQYKVPMWSKRHFELMGKSFKLLGELGNKVVYITMIRRTHFGNEHGMVRWSRNGVGYKPDLGFAEKYLDLAIKHMGKVPVVVLYCWGSQSSQGQGEYRRQAQQDRKINFTLLDPRTGKLTEAVGPKWGTPKCRAFWKPAITGMYDLLRKRGMADSMMLGLAGDRLPTVTAMKDLEGGLAKPKWALHAHYRNEVIQGRPVGSCVLRWASSKITDPDERRGYGWRDPFREARAPFVSLGAGGTPASQRTFIEAWLTASASRSKTRGIRGFGRRGADFWPVLKNKRGRVAPLINRYIESRWSALTMFAGTTHLLSPGRDGAIPTMRYETIRESLQDCHARIFIEEALLNPARKARVGADLARRCRELLDYRVRAYLLLRNEGPRRPNGMERIWFTSSGWEAASGDIYKLAAEVAGKLGTGR